MDPTAHRRIWEAIPWVVNGSAAPAERAAVLEHIDQCAECRDEFRFQTELQRGIAAPTAAPTGDPDRPLARLWARVDRVEGDADAAAPRGERWQRVLAAAVIVQAVALAALASVLWTREPAAAYQTLSQAAVAAPDAAVRMVPAPGLAIADLKPLLERCGVEVAASNADASILTLALRRDAGIGVDEALRRLRAEPRVSLAEPLVGAGSAPR